MAEAVFGIKRDSEIRKVIKQICGNNNGQFPPKREHSKKAMQRKDREVKVVKIIKQSVPHSLT